MDLSNRPVKRVKLDETTKTPDNHSADSNSHSPSPVVYDNNNSQNEDQTLASSNQNDFQAVTNYVDTNYFSCYADLSIHRVMIGDHTRTQTYRRAILHNYKLFHRKVVLDVGAGTGILSVFCAQAGASKVYAIEASAVAEQAQKVVDSNGYSDIIVVMQQKVEDVVLPEKVDIIVSEWMGYMLMYESMLPSLLYARDRWLKQGGWLFPEVVKIYIAPINDDQEYDYSVRFWKKVSDMYGVKMDVLSKTAEEQMQSSIQVVSVEPSSIQSHASCFAELDLASVDTKVTECTEGDFHCNCFGKAAIHGFVIWFTVHFPNNITLSTSPYTKETHWEQSVMYIPPIHVEQGTLISGHVQIRRDVHYYRFLDIELEYKIDGGNPLKLQYKMKD